MFLPITIRCALHCDYCCQWLHKHPQSTRHTYGFCQHQSPTTHSMESRLYQKGVTTQENILCLENHRDTKEASTIQHREVDIQRLILDRSTRFRIGVRSILEINQEI